MKKARKKNEKDDLFFNEIFSNPIHGEYNKEKQLEIIGGGVLLSLSGPL